VLIYSMSVSVDGFIADREGAFGWTTPNEEQFRFHLALTRELGGYLCGRRLYETMLPWETDPSLRDNELGAAFRSALRARASWPRSEKQGPRRTGVSRGLS
jgi:dihydrofolate reductase